MTEPLTGSAFGMATPWDMNGPDPIADNPAETTEQATQEPTAPIQEILETPEVPDSPGTQEATPDPAAPATEATTTEGTPAAPLFIVDGRPFNRIEDVEQSYREIRQLQQRTAERERAARAEAAQLRAYFEQALPYLQRMAAEQQNPTTPAQAPDLETDPQGWARHIQEQARVEAARAAQGIAGQQAQQMQAQLEQMRLQTTAEAAIGSFRTAHPEVTANSVEEARVVEVMQEFGLDLRSAHLETAYQIAANPALAEKFRAFPELARRGDAGMAAARQLAGLPTPTGGTQPAPATRQPADLAAAQRRAHVERGPSGPPAPARPKTVIDELLGVDAEREKSAFFGGIRPTPTQA
jgi:hypothetical protein